ncbi:hypothetical protein I4U23_022610 [Adineta vaga]|nr:hypothetical protein I4U23_022610 [Adineta vaga]
METSKDDNVVLSMFGFIEHFRELDEQTKETTHHNFITVLKEIACNPVPHVSSQIIDIYKDLQEKNYNRKEFLNKLRENGATDDYDREELDEMIQKLEASRGYGEKETKRLINFIRKCHSYNKSMITKMLETLNVPDQYTILHYGALFNNVSFCRCLIIDFGCNVNLVSSDGETVLHIAARLINTKYPDRPSSILEYLLNHPQIQINIQDNQGRTPLHFAVIYNCPGNVKYLIEHGANLSISDIGGAIPLHYACRFLQNNRTIELFLNFPQLFNCETYDKRKPIDIAIEYNDPILIKRFLTHSKEKILSLLKEQYDRIINANDSLLYFACHQLHGHKKISHLINSNSIMYRDKETGLSPLMIAVQYRQFQYVKELLQNKSFTQEAFELISHISFRTVLHICTKIHNKDITKTLFDSHFISNTLTIAADVLGDTPLHMCAQFGNVYMAQLLLNYVNNYDSFATTTKVTPHTMLMKMNKNKLTPLHMAIQAGHLDVINEMLRYTDLSILNMRDDQLRTCLHMAAAKGHIGIVNILLQYRADSHCCDINEWTPLHHAMQNEKNVDDEERLQCIESLVIRGMSNINALSIRRETPLHIACKFSSSKLVKQMIKFDCDLFIRNVDDYNCLEVAIEANNEEVVQYLIENDNCFDLMRNSQIREKKRSCCSLRPGQYEVDTPMRKLIRKMPRMGLLMLNKCSMIVGTEGTAIHQNIFMYEFLEDQFTVNKWNSDTSKTERHSELYTSNTVNLVMNHPLFLMAQYEAYDLMSHSLSNYLVKLKFKNFGIFLYILLLLLYSIYLGLFTTIVLRAHHPGIYYNLTNIDFQDSLCYNVSQVLLTTYPNLGGIKTTIDYLLKYSMYTVIGLLISKNIFNIIEICQMDFSKTLRYWLETFAVMLSFHLCV